MHIRVAGLALPVVISLGLAVTSCSSKPSAVQATVPASGAAVSGSSSASPSSPGSVPAGYTRVGGAVQGISVAAPAAWAAVNLAKETIDNAAKRIKLGAVSSAALVQDMESLQKLHAVVVYDIKSAVDSPQHFARNLNAYCVVSGVTDTGAAGIPLLKSGTMAEFTKLGATSITQRNVEIGGVSGLETSYHLSSSAGTIDASQLEVMPKPDKVCFVTESSGVGESAGQVLSVAAATAQFP